MSTLFKSTIIFSGPGHGWTESWWQDRTNNDYDGALRDIDKVAQRRAAMLGNQCAVIGIRTSQQDLKNDGIAKGVNYTNGSQSPACDNDEPDACLCIYAHDVADARRKAVFLRGIPDSIDVQFGKFVEDACGFKTALDSWWKLISAAFQPFGWYGRPLAGPSRANITGYTTGATGQVTMNFDAPLFNPLVVGKKTVVTISGLNTPAKSVLNGQQVVTVLSTTSCQTVKPIAVFPYSHQGKGLWSVSEFIAASEYTVSRIATRRVGAPLLVSHGRLRVRPKG